MAATPQGSAAEKLRGGSVPSAPAGVPQRWQNRAAGERGAPQDAHAAGARVAPQFEQNFPDAGDWHAGQMRSASGAADEDGGMGEVMREQNYTAETVCVQYRWSVICTRDRYEPWRRTGCRNKT